jgi:biopolymer transport protein ExbD
LPNLPNQSAQQSDPADAEATTHHISARKKRGLPPAKMQLNLTSMIDVIFQLLVYFVVTASFTIGEGVITAKLPQGGANASEAKDPKTPVHIILSSAGIWNVSVTIQSKSLHSFSELEDYLVELQHDRERMRNGVYRPDHPLIIKPDGEVRWQHVVNAFNAAVAARYTNVSFATVTK